MCEICRGKCNKLYSNCLVNHSGYLGNDSGSPTLSMVNSFGPLLPFRALNPSNGILDVPVTNCTSNMVTMVTRLVNTDLKETQSLFITEILNHIPE